MTPWGQILKNLGFTQVKLKHIFTWKIILKLYLSLS